MRDDLDRRSSHRDYVPTAVAILAAVLLGALMLLALSGCSTTQPPANDYLPVQYSGLTSCASQSAIDNRQ